MSTELNKQESLIIVGGGITGLSTAYLAAKAGKKVKVLEAGSKFGGLLNTFEIGGGRLEFYYHHFFTHDLELHWLVKELGLEEELFYQKTSMGVFNKGVIYPFNSPVDLLKFKPIHFFDKIRFGLTSIYLGKYADWRKFEHISAVDWFKKWAGKSTTNSLWKPLLDIKFGPYADQVPLTWMIGRLRQRMSSRKSGDERLGYLKGSLQSLLDRLLERLEALGVELVPNAPVTDVELNGVHLSALVTPSGRQAADQYVFTIPSPIIARLFNDKHQGLADKMAEVEYFGAVCVILEMDRPLSAIYWLNIADDQLPFGGIIEHTNFISPEHYGGRHIAYLSRYFAASEPIAKMSNDEIDQLLTAGVAKVHPHFDPKQVVATHVFKTPYAATVCDLGFSAKVPDCATAIPNVFIANMSHVYPDERSTNNSIRIAAATCNALGIKHDLDKKTNSLSARIGFSSN